ncbi:MAG: DUF4436 family protein [Mycobacterium kyogaense]|uniref:DUF4436 family protein n=1 Tax=Mycobacterium kyogaense TaxID=2212479 RepID=UPI002FF714B4
MPPASDTTSTDKPAENRPRALTATVLTTVLAIMAIYIASLVGYRFLEQPPQHFAFDDGALSSQTSVIVRLRQVDAPQNELAVDVVLHPGADLLADGPDATADATIRLSSWTDEGQLIYVHDDLQSNRTSTSLIAVGEPDDWPFDSYRTDVIGVEALVGQGAAQRSVPASIVVAGSVNAWQILPRVRTLDAPWGQIQTVQFSLERTRGALAIDLGILLVLLALPATALFVAIEMLLHRRKFQPPFITWFAAMLFAVVPLRNILPGAPEPGAWIDQAVILWVLVALAAAMVIFVVAWWRQTRTDPKPEKVAK